MKCVFIKSVFLLLVVLLSNNTLADRLLVHKDEQVAMDELMKKLGVDENNISIGKKKHDINYYSDYFDAGTRYYHKNKGMFGFSVITNDKGHVARLVIRGANIGDISDILAFKQLVILEIISTDIASLDGIEYLKYLVRLEVVDNKQLTNLNGIKNLHDLTEIYVGIRKNVKLSNMKNLPKLREFLCGSCMIDDVSIFSEMKELKVFKAGIKQADINSLSGLKNIEVLEIGGESLVDVSAVNNMPKLKHLKISETSLKELKLNGSTPDLEYFRIVGAPITELPNFRKFKKLKELSIVDTNVSEVSAIHSLPELENLVFSGNKKLKSISNIKNLPKLKYLRATNRVTNDFRSGSLPSLEELDLSSTGLTELSGFENYPNLRRLILNDTKVKSFKGLEKAASLYWVQSDYEVMSIPENVKIIRGLRRNRIKRY